MANSKPIIKKTHIFPLFVSMVYNLEGWNPSVLPRAICKSDKLNRKSCMHCMCCFISVFVKHLVNTKTYGRFLLKYDLCRSIDTIFSQLKRQIFKFVFIVGNPKKKEIKLIFIYHISCNTYFYKFQRKKTIKPFDWSTKVNDYVIHFNKLIHN